MDDAGGGLKSYCGTPQYFSPEVLQRKFTVAGQGAYSLEADMWSIGVVLYVLLSGAYPFHEDTLFHQIQSAEYTFATNAIWQTISAEAKDLICKLIVVDPKQRLTAHRALEHPWFSQSMSSPTTVERDLPMLPPKGIPSAKRSNRRIGPSTAAESSSSLSDVTNQPMSRYRTRSSTAKSMMPETNEDDMSPATAASPTKRLKIDTSSVAAASNSGKMKKGKGK